MKAAQFVDLAQQGAREYDPGKRTVSVVSIGSDDAIDFDHLATLMRLVSEWSPALKPSGSRVELVGQAWRDVSEASRRWTEFTLRFHDPNGRGRHAVEFDSRRLMSLRDRNSPTPEGEA